MSDIPVGYQVGATERRLLERLETFRRRGVPLLPSDFASKVGLAGTSSLKRYIVLKAALHEYGWQSAPARMRGNRPSLLTQLQLGPSAETEKIAKDLARARAELEEVAEQKDMLQRELEGQQKQTKELKGVLMATINLLTGSDVEMARRLDAKLLDMIRGGTETEESNSALNRTIIDIRSRRGVSDAP
jgi:hypothetical protein